MESKSVRVCPQVTTHLRDGRGEDEISFPSRGWQPCAQIRFPGLGVCPGRKAPPPLLGGAWQPARLSVCEQGLPKPNPPLQPFPLAVPWARDGALASEQPIALEKAAFIFILELDHSPLMSGVKCPQSEATRKVSLLVQVPTADRGLSSDFSVHRNQLGGL